ncbi:MAG TPA: hypothetical protein VLC06_22165 [Polyangia bacterium]|nr:hypothetical protein [Polyangia bacterium]
MKTWRELEGSGGATASAAAAPNQTRRTVPALALLLWLALVASTVGAVAALGPLLGIHPSPPTLAVLALGALAVHFAPERAFEVTALTGLVALAATNRPYALYHAALVGLLFVARNGTWALAALLGLLAIWLPKHLFASHYHQPTAYGWINEPSLVLVLFVTACWWRTRRDGRLPPAAKTASPLAWSLMYLFPGHALNPMVFAPSDVFRTRRLDVRGIGAGLLLVALKAGAHTAIGRFLGQASYAGLDAARMAALTRAQLWEVVSINYLDLVVTLSGTSDVAILLARLYGWPMASPFRFALLAWNPVELWRRWGIYNRKLLLTLVYFPLGGNQRHRTRNVLATFLGSALLLHTGWFGSKYWAIGLGGWRDQTVYFLVQGLLVCGCLWYRDLRGDRRESADHTLRWSWSRAAGTVATQGASALAHVIILAHALPFAARFGLIARCLALR